MKQIHTEMTKKYSPNIYDTLPVELTKGEGVFVWDIHGKKYYDCLSGYSSMNQGHCHPKIVEALRHQAGILTLTSRKFHNDKLGGFLKKISGLTELPKVIPMNSGAEAVETAIKAMRRHAYVKRGIRCPLILVMQNNFHGRTTTIVSFSSDPESRRGFGPFDRFGFDSLPFNSIGSLEERLEHYAYQTRQNHWYTNDRTIVAGILMEPIQGEGGVNIPDENYLKEVYDLCKEHNILLALDEIQTGLGRTGKMFAYQHSSPPIKPDILILGKALSGGVYPISACCMTEEVAEVFTPHSHGSTYGGNPLAAEVGVAAIDVIIDENLSNRAKIAGEQMLTELSLLREFSIIKEVRGKGLLVGIEFHKPIASKVARDLIKRGILAGIAQDRTIRIAPPLTISSIQVLDISHTLYDHFRETKY